MTLPGTLRPRFATRAGTLLALIGVAVGLGNVWRFPYMAGRFGGAAFVLYYVLAVGAIGIPALMAEWSLGRSTRRGPVGAFAAAGFPFGRTIGWALFAIVTAAAAYYTNVVGWVLFHAVGQLAAAARIPLDASRILPPRSGVSLTSLLLQAVCTAAVILACVLALERGLRRGIEAASRWIMPALLVILLILIGRGLTLPGAREGLAWFLIKFQPGSLSGSVMLAALGQAIFSLSLGGTFMVVYGSYLSERDDLTANAAWTAAGDVGAGLLAGLAVFPAVFALGLEPAGGPGLVFSTLPEVFSRLPGGWLPGVLFFLGLFGAAYLSDVAAFEVLVAGLTDNTAWSRRRAVRTMAVVVFVAAIPPMVNTSVFVPWDLAFGSGAQTVGALAAVVAVGWCMDRATALEQLRRGGGRRVPRWLYAWIRFAIPGAIMLVAGWWLASEVLHLVG